MFKPLKKSLMSAAAVSALLCVPAYAAQKVEGCYQRHVEVALSSVEQSMLSIEGRKVAALAPSKPGILDYSHKPELNAVFLAFKPEHTAGTVTLFITDSQGDTCTLLLAPRPVAGDTITIVPPGGKHRATDPDGKALPYQRRVKNLLLQMAGAVPTDGLPVQVVGADIPLWEGTRLVFKRRYLDEGFVGEVYDLTNVGPGDMQLAEQELYRNGVVAVAIAEHTLPVGASTTVYVVRTRGEHE